MIDYRRFQPYVPNIFLGFFLILLIPNYFYVLPEPGLDPSWNIALHLAHQDKLIHGEDFVFTYGPLGVLNARYPISVNLFVYLLADVYFLSVMFFILRNVLKRRFNPGVALFIFLSIVTTMYEGIYQWYFFFFLYFLFSFIGRPKNFGTLIHAALLSLVCFYFKLSFGIVAIFIFFSTIIYCVIRKKITVPFLAATLAIYFFSLWLSATLLLVNLKGYVSGALKLIDGYNDAMFTLLSPQFEVYSLVAIITVVSVVLYILGLFVLSLRRNAFIKEIDQFFIYSIICLTVYIVFKSGFVRADGHVFVFFKGLALFMPLFYLFSHDKFQRKMAAVCCWAALVISFWAVNAIPGSYKPYTRILTGSIIPIKIGELKLYFSGLANYNDAVENSRRLLSSKNHLKNLIGNHSVDVVPTEISKVYFNGLRYSPRPVIQSYSAYGEYLDELNYQRYISEKAPDYILFQLASIDDRFPYFDESKTKLAILTHYDVVGEYEGDLILRKKSAPDRLILKEKQEIIDAKFGEEVPVSPGQSLQYSKLLVKYDLRGKLNRLLYTPPLLRMVVTLENGDTRTYKTIKPIIEGGVVLNKFIDNELEFKLLMLGEGLLNTPVKSIRLEADPVNPGFVTDYQIVSTFYDLKKAPGAGKVADSLSIVAMLEQFRPAIVPSDIPENQGLRYHLEDVSTHGQFFRLGGWAFTEKADNSGSAIGIALRAADTTYQLPTVTASRPDLPVVFQRPDLGNAGFLSTVSRSQLPGGSYQVGIMVLDKSGHKSVKFTDQYVRVQQSFKLEKIDAPGNAYTNDINTRANLDLIRENKNSIILEGWAVADNEDTRTSSTFLVLQSREGNYKIPTDKRRRRDVSADLNNPKLEYSGFFAEIPKDKVPKGSYTIAIGKKLPGDKTSLVRTTETVKFGYGDFFEPEPIASLPPAADFAMGIDLFEDKNEFVTVAGWAVLRTDIVNNSLIKVVLKNENSINVAETQSALRPDITAHFHSKVNLDRSGFSTKISKRQLTKGKYQVGIILKDSSGSEVSKMVDNFVIQ